MLDARRRMTTPMPLLLADGSRSARLLIRRVLAESRFSFEIEDSEDGRHALKALQLGSYDVALIDRHLPGLDGLELACQAAQTAPQTKLMLMAAGDAASVAQAVRQFGIAALLKKPFYLWDVEIALHTAFGLRRPYLLNALPAHLEAEGLRLRERLAEAKRIEREGVAAPAPEPAEAESVFYLRSSHLNPTSPSRASTARRAAECDHEHRRRDRDRAACRARTRGGGGPDGSARPRRRRFGGDAARDVGARLDHRAGGRHHRSLDRR
jgi:CheY-like chemotaxis protein